MLFDPENDEYMIIHQANTGDMWGTQQLIHTGPHVVIYDTE